ncbi:hypothetical protein EDD18DRAFT_1102598 [Armillaria luteobubalina]|uniref:DUF6593 domain-containing protein n=1 Tax=Armillaria luteobubalina TaxID=153913 RepID=A0AA39QCU2_9AGAR|nr:hypothetical protein EDD18DRAFT_1102598 [Armillaria luteobubalina]
MSQNASLILTLQPDNPCNTTITDQDDDGKTLYQVYTQYEPSVTTFVKNGAGDIIASWEWREIRSDIITVFSGSPTPVSSWLKKSIVPLKGTVTFEDHAGRKYKWKGNGPGLSFELIFDERGEEIRDLIVISFLVLEKTRRTTENSTMNMTDALFPGVLS